MTTAYDEVDFQSLPSPEKSPARIATIASFFGFSPIAVESARVLEIGCGTGANLIQLAVEFPEAQFFGIDLSQKHIEVGQADIKAMGLKNVSISVESFGDFDKEKGEFDYILSFGLYSWVVPKVQKALIKIIHRHLSSEGLACISYNTLPGWGVRSGLGRLLQVCDDPKRSPEERVLNSRALFALLDEVAIDDYSPYGMMLREEIKQLGDHSDGFFYHEMLAEHCSANYFYDFAARAKKTGLRYVGDARLSRTRYHRLDTGSLNSFEKLDDDELILRREQTADILFPTSLRTSIFCKSKRKIGWNVSTAAFKKLFITSTLIPISESRDVKSDIPMEFCDAREFTEEVSNSLVKAMLLLLSEAWPESVTVDFLVEEALEKFDLIVDQEGVEIALRGLIDLFRKGLLDVRINPLKCIKFSEAKPEAHPFARRQASRQDWVSNYRHEYAKLDSFERILLPLLDGTRDEKELLSELMGKVKSGDLTMAEEGSKVEDEAKQLSLVQQKLVDSIAKFFESALIGSSLLVMLKE